MPVHILTIKAGHAFDEVKCREAFSDKMLAESWGDAKCAELLEAAVKEDSSFDCYSFFYKIDSYIVDEALEAK